jgi:hypothetical protein
MHHIDLGAVTPETNVVLVDGQDDARDYRIGVYRCVTGGVRAGTRPGT